MLKALLKVNAAAFIHWITGGNKRAGKPGKNSKGRMIAYAALFLYVFGVFGWLFAQMFTLLAEPMYLSGTGWLYFVYVFIMAFALMFIFSVFSAKNRLFDAKDNDLLLSMPIPPSYILGSRMLLLWAINLLFGVFVMGPAVYVWFKVVPFDGLALLFMLLLFIALSLFALAASALFGWLLAALSARARRKALFETVFSLVFLAAYMVFYMRINQIVQNLLANNDAIADSMAGVKPLYLLGAGAAGDAKAFFLGLLILLIPFVLAYILLSKNFIKTATKKRGTAKVKYEATEQKVSSRGKALLRREAARFFSSSTCIVNNGLGAIFLIVAAVVLLIYKNRISAMLYFMEPGVAQYAVGGIIVIITLMAGMIQPTSCLVSLEGKGIWIVQSMPVPPAEVLLAKLRLSLILYEPPVLLCAAAAMYVISPPSELAVLGILLPTVLVLVMAEVGLIANVNHPMLDWTTETQAVKSGISVLLAMLYDFGITALLGGGGYLLLTLGVSMEMALMGFLVAALIAARLLYIQIVRRSADKFAYL